MELCIHFTALPEGMDLERMKKEVAFVLEEDGWLTGSGSDGDRSWLELELEDERANPKYGIMAVRSYLEKTHFPADTTIELAGMESPIYG